MKYLILALLLMGCSKKGTYTPVKNAVDHFQVEKLFTVDGCTVYRFADVYTRYFASCRGSVSSEVPEGKNNTRSDETPTEIVK